MKKSAENLFPVIILAGGLATRLRPLTETIPKALVDVNGEPFISHQLRLLYRQGIRKVILSVGYLGETIQEFVGAGDRFGLSIEYSFDGERLLGTSGAIKKALPLLMDNFFVLYGDSYLPCDFKYVQAIFVQSNKPALMTVFHNQGLWDTSNIEYVKGHILVYDKVNRTERMNYIDYGLGVFNKKMFDSVPENAPHDLSLIYQQALKDKQLAACEVKERFYETGSFAGIKELERYIVCNS